MTRVKTGTVSKKRHKKVLKAAKGYFGSKHRLYKTAKEQLMHSGQYAFRDRKQKKRDFRKLWITRINAACRENEISYSRFINGLAKAGVDVNRKMLSEIAINDPKAFTELVKVAKAGLDGKAKAAPKEVKNEIVKGNKKEAKAEVKKETKKEEKKEDKKEEKKATTKKVDYASMTVAELKELASKKKIEGASKMKKAELVEALSK
ncbi:MAG: 50S ribosomal protein L20 [Bacilli bacterium]|nr:50S ribosomal protein L20 [Bacilli bacterium]